jgi:hypothetical protein
MYGTKVVKVFLTLLPFSRAVYGNLNGDRFLNRRTLRNHSCGGALLADFPVLLSVQKYIIVDACRNIRIYFYIFQTSFGSVDDLIRVADPGQGAGLQTSSATLCFNIENQPLCVLIIRSLAEKPLTVMGFIM